MDEEEIETPMEEEGTQRRMYEEYRGAVPFYYRGWAIVTLALISIKLPLLWVAVIYLIIMRNLRIIDYFDALEKQIKEGFQELADSYADSTEKLDDSYAVPMGRLDEARNAAEESNRLMAEADERARDRNFRELAVKLFGTQEDEISLRDQELESLRQEKQALELAVKRWRETHEHLQQYTLEENEKRRLESPAS